MVRYKNGNGNFIWFLCVTSNIVVPKHDQMMINVTGHKMLAQAESL